MKILSFFIIIIIFSLFFSQCDQCHNPTYNLSNDQSNFSNIKEGSYWIMKDSLTGERDSFVLDRINNGHYAAYTSTQCFDNVQIKDLDINEYSLATNTKIDTISWYIEFDGRGFQVLHIEYISRYAPTSNSTKFSLVGTNSNVLINGKYYNSVDINQVSLNQDFITSYINSSDILLKVAFTNIDDKRVWELEKSNVIR